MKKKFLLSFLIVTIVAITFVGCSKDNYMAECETNNTGTLIIENNTSDSYNCYINDVFLTSIKGNSVVELDDVEAKFHILKCYEVVYLINQNVYEAGLILKQCDTYTATMN